MADLEANVSTLRNKAHDLEDRLNAIEAREASLQAWVRELENAMIAQGHREQVDTLRRVWGQSAGMIPAPHHDLSSSVGMSNASRGDPLATLASAASTFQHPRVAQPYNMRPSEEDDESSSRKRRREDDYSYATANGNGSNRGDRLPSPSRMRIADLVLPLPRPTGSTPVLHQPHPYQGWPSHLPAIDQAFGYEQKPRINTDARDATPTDRRPLSSSSSNTARTWSSPVQSFEIRL